MKHLDLFSGIGCWALASAEVWPDREMVGFCEIDHFCMAVLNKHFPDVPIYEDIRTLADADGAQKPKQSGSDTTGQETSPTASRTRDRARPGTSDRAGLRPAPKRIRQLATSTEKLYDIDLLTASPPCQGASSAGQRKGTADNRWLWPQTFAVIARTRPRWVVLENVRGLLSLEGGLVFDDLLSRMEKDGYEVWPFVAPAAGVGAPHRRERVWIVGRNVNDAGSEKSRGLPTSEREKVSASGDSNSDAADTGRERRDKRRGESVRPQEQKAAGTNLPNSRRDWNRPWQEVARETCWADAPRAGDDGISNGSPARLYGPDRISEAAHRRERLKACGNAIVPAVAVEIFKAIRYAEEVK